MRFASETHRRRWLAHWLAKKRRARMVTSTPGEEAGDFVSGLLVDYEIQDADNILDFGPTFTTTEGEVINGSDLYSIDLDINLPGANADYQYLQLLDENGDVINTGGIELGRRMSLVKDFGQMISPAVTAQIGWNQNDIRIYASVVGFGLTTFKRCRALTVGSTLSNHHGEIAWPATVAAHGFRIGVGASHPGSGTIRGKGRRKNKKGA